MVRKALIQKDNPGKSGEAGANPQNAITRCVLKNDFSPLELIPDFLDDTALQLFCIKGSYRHFPFLQFSSSAIDKQLINIYDCRNFSVYFQNTCLDEPFVYEIALQIPTSNPKILTFQRRWRFLFGPDSILKRLNVAANAQVIRLVMEHKHGLKSDGA